MRIFGFTRTEFAMVAAVSFCVVTLISSPPAMDIATENSRIIAQKELQHLASALEKYYQANQTYENATLEALGINDVVANHHYLLRIASATADGYFLQAHPLAEQAFQDDQCGTLTLSPEGEKGATGATGIEHCWKAK